jgi:hypothetical protein
MKSPQATNRDNSEKSKVFKTYCVPVVTELALFHAYVEKVSFHKKLQIFIILW